MRRLTVVKLFRRLKFIDLIGKEAPANFVPAAAVKRGGQALFVVTGRKGSVDGLHFLQKHFVIYYIFLFFYVF